MKNPRNRNSGDLSFNRYLCYSFKAFSIISFKAGLEGRGASTETILPSLSKTIKRGIAFIW